MIRKAKEIIGTSKVGENVIYKLECGHRGYTLNDWPTDLRIRLDGDFECIQCDDEE